MKISRVFFFFDRLFKKNVKNKKNEKKSATFTILLGEFFQG